MWTDLLLTCLQSKLEYNQGSSTLSHTHTRAPADTQTHINIHLDSSNLVRLPWKDYISSENKEEKPHHASALFAMSKAKANTFYLEIINSY